MPIEDVAVDRRPHIQRLQHVRHLAGITRPSHRGRCCNLTEGGLGFSDRLLFVCGVFAVGLDREVLPGLLLEVRGVVQVGEQPGPGPIRIPLGHLFQLHLLGILPHFLVQTVPDRSSQPGLLNGEPVIRQLENHFALNPVLAQGPQLLGSVIPELQDVVELILDALSVLVALIDQMLREGRTGRDRSQHVQRLGLRSPTACRVSQLHLQVGDVSEGEGQRCPRTRIGQSGKRDPLAVVDRLHRGHGNCGRDRRRRQQGCDRGHAGHRDSLVPGLPPDLRGGDQHPHLGRESRSIRGRLEPGLQCGIGGPHQPRGQHPGTGGQHGILRHRVRGRLRPSQRLVPLPVSTEMHSRRHPQRLPAQFQVAQRRLLPEVE